MNYEVVALNPDYLGTLLEDAPESVAHFAPQLACAYFSRGSVSLCLLVDGEPVFAGGIVNMQWHRGEAWILPTPFFRLHLKTCLRELLRRLPRLAADGGFVRVQATCVKGISASLIEHLGFSREGTMRKFGPNGEICDMYARIFEVGP